MIDGGQLTGESWLSVLKWKVLKIAKKQNKGHYPKCHLLSFDTTVNSPSSDDDNYRPLILIMNSCSKLMIAIFSPFSSSTLIVDAFDSIPRKLLILKLVIRFLLGGGYVCCCNCHSCRSSNLIYRPIRMGTKNSITLTYMHTHTCTRRLDTVLI